MGSQEKGDPGTWRQVLRWLRKRRQQEQFAIDGSTNGIKTDNAGGLLTPPHSSDKMPSPRALAWLMVRQPTQLESQERNGLSLIEQDTQVKKLYAVAQQFGEIIRKGKATQLDQWLEDCKASQISMLQTFAARIRQDYAAVRAALETEWSNGQKDR